MEIAFFSLKGSNILKIDGEAKSINIFIYELISKFNHTINSQANTISLQPLQRNTEILRISVSELISKYSSKIPPINKLNVLLNILDENEYFFIYILKRELSQEESYNIISSLMKLNLPNFNLSEHIEKSNKLFRNIWDNYRIITPVAEKNIKIGESDKSIRQCRFCGRGISTGAKFKSEAHAISEALGNKTIILNEECDDCNSYFDQFIERDLITYLNLFRTFFGIMNKSNKVPTIKGKNFEYSNLGKNKISLKVYSDDEEADEDINPDLNISLKYNEKIVAQNLYKALVKFALSIFDTTDLIGFDETMKWIRNPGFKDKLPKVAHLISYEFFRSQPRVMVYLRTSDDDSLPYAVGEFHFTCFTYVFIIPTFSNLEPDFTNQDHFSKFWKFFKHFSMIEEFKFNDFSDSIKKNVEFKLNFECENKE